MKLQLGKFLIGHKIIDIKILDTRILGGDTKKLIGGKVIGTRRFGKVSVIDLDNNYSILTHVKLTGQFIYNDVRRFGWIRIEKTEDVEKEKFIVKLGPEPHVAKGFAGQALTLDLFKQILSKTSRPIKIVLMDQEKMGGVGNIYATDALWLAKVNPKTEANKLQSDRVTKLYEAILSVLKAGLKYGGASELAFVTPDGREGEYQNHTLAYGHTGEPCERCHKAVFIKYFLGGRGTYVCPNCQS